MASFIFLSFTAWWTTLGDLINHVTKSNQITSFLNKKFWATTTMFFKVLPDQGMTTMFFFCWPLVAVSFDFWLPITYISVNYMFINMLQYNYSEGVKVQSRLREERKTNKTAFLLFILKKKKRREIYIQERYSHSPTGIV